MKNENILKTSSINILVRFVSLSLVFLFQALLTKFISIESYSIFSQFIIYSNYLSILLSFGLSASLIYFPQKDKEFISSYFSILLLYVLIFLVVSAVFLSLFKSPYYYFYIIAFGSLINMITVSLAYYQFTKQFLTYAIIGGLQAILILLLLLFIYVTNNTDIQLILQLYIGVNIIYFLFIMSSIFVKNKNNIRYFVAVNKSYFSYGIKISTLILASQLIYITDYILIDFFLENKELAFYFIAMTVSKMIFILADTTGSILFPLYAKAKNHRDRKNKIDNDMRILASLIFTISILVLGIILVFGNKIIEIIYNIEYQRAYVPIILLVAGTQGMIIYKLLSRKLAVENGWKILYTSVLISAFINIVLNIVLIPEYGINGAAFSSMLSYWLCGFIIVKLSGEKLHHYLFYFKKGPT